MENYTMRRIVPLLIFENDFDTPKKKTELLFAMLLRIARTYNLSRAVRSLNVAAGMSSISFK